MMFHFTCVDGWRGIQRVQYVAPNWHPLIDARLAWFTDMPDPDPVGLGLTSDTLTCDRTAHRIAVDPTLVVQWVGSPWHMSMSLADQMSLHGGGRMFDRWFVSDRRVPVA